jgi:AcrR family transcriptional regulator
MLDFQDQPKTQAAAHRRSGPSYADMLSRDLARPDFSRKRHRTRRRLIAAAAGVLQSHGLERLRVADIASAAGASPATFYVYFTDRADIANRVLRQFCDYLYASEPAAQAAAEPAQLRRRITAHLALAQANGGLLRALGEAILTMPDMADHVGGRRADWIAKTMAATPVMEGTVAHGGRTELLDVLMRGVLDRFASPASGAGAGVGFADRVAEVWLAMMAGPAEPHHQRFN